MKKVMLKSNQSYWWSTIIEAITANSDALDLGIIFKGKEL
jgi:predicted phosphohydrolase